MNKLPWEKIEREILVKREATTNDEYGTYPEKRTTEELINNGIITVNKPSGPTSHLVTDYVKKILNIKKAGHGGTLDPKVTGVLPIALGKATRIVQTLLPAGKEYVALMHLHSEIEKSKIKNSAKELIGKITQLPPIRSAVKRRERQKTIYYIEILEIKDKDVLFKIGCQGGFYVRKFIHEWALKLKTKGHMAQLVRTKAGPFNDKEWYSLYDIKDAYELYKEGNDPELRKILKPVEHAIQHLPKIWIQDSAVDTLCHGADLSIPGIVKLESKIEPDQLVAILTLKNELICLGRAKLASNVILREQKGIAVKTKKVFMEPDTYPKFIKT